jgi:hypothetical protein
MLQRQRSKLLFAATYRAEQRTGCISRHAVGLKLTMLPFSSDTLTSVHKHAAEHAHKQNCTDVAAPPHLLSQQARDMAEVNRTAFVS